CHFGKLTVTIQHLPTCYGIRLVSCGPLAMKACSPKQTSSTRRKLSTGVACQHLTFRPRAKSGFTHKGDLDAVLLTLNTAREISCLAKTTAIPRARVPAGKSSALAGATRRATLPAASWEGSLRRNDNRIEGRWKSQSGH